jgi:hypothetical protein
VKPYAETVPPDKLQVGTVYFAVNFIDDEMLIPIMEPKVFGSRGDTPTWVLHGNVKIRYATFLAGDEFGYFHFTTMDVIVVILKLRT